MNTNGVLTVYLCTVYLCTVYLWRVKETQMENTHIYMELGESKRMLNMNTV